MFYGVQKQITKIIEAEYEEILYPTFLFSRLIPYEIFTTLVHITFMTVD